MIIIEKPLCVKNMISEQGHAIIDEIASSRVIGILAPMKSGKTYFMINDLNYYCMDKGYKLIIVIPTTTQLDQLYNRDEEKKLSAQYARFKAKKESRVIITTPDSLPKVVKLCEELSQKFILSIDEAHEIELSYMYRKAFKNVLDASKNTLCKCTLMFSATLDNLILSNTVTFDKFINVDVDNKFFNAKNFEVMTMKKQSSSKIISLLKKLGQEYEQVFYKVDSHQKLNEINEVLETTNKEVKAYQNSLLGDEPLIATIEEKENNIYLSSKNKKGNKINEQIITDKIIPKEFKYIGFTSLVNSGVEIKTSGKIVVVNFANKTFNFANEIQFIGRFRNGVELYIITIPEPVEVKRLELKRSIANEKENGTLTDEAIKERDTKRYLPKLLTYETISESVKKYATLEVEHQNKMYTEFKDIFYDIEDARLEAKNLNKPYVMFNEDNCKFEIDEIALNAYCYDKYIKQLLNFPKLLLEKFKDHRSLNINDSYKLTSFDEEDKKINKIIKEIKDQQEFQLEKNKNEIQNSMKYLADNLDDKNLKLLLDKQLAIEYTENKKLKEHLENWEQLREQKEKDIYTLTRYIKDISEIEAFKIIANITNETELKNIFQCANIVLLNKIYNKNSNDLNFKKNKRHYKLKITRDLIEADNKINDKSITEEIRKNLFNLYIKEGIIKNKEFTEAKEKALVNYLMKIYKFKKNNNEESKKLIISSLRTDVKYLINIRSIE